MISYSVYIVDDDQILREGITTVLEQSYRVKAFSRADRAIESIKHSPPDLVLLDIGLPGISGIEALGKIKDLTPDILVVMITASDDINMVISCMKLGAYDYVVKPIHMDSLEVTIHNALQTIRLRKEVETLQEKYLKENLPFFVSESNVIQDVMEFVGKVARSPDTPILIVGETGTGKELVASTIHYRSPNFKGPFITVNCAAIPKDLIESELFGYERGAFTGARSSGKIGLIEEATNGTLFLDEVGDLNLESQSKLLRFLEEGEFYKIGGTKKCKIKTRVVSATNRNINQMVSEGLFRKDLYFRLGVIKVEIPSLNDRRDDIVPIAKHFLLEFSRKIGKTFTSLSPVAEDALKNFRWEGNIRELKNLVERGVLIGHGPELTLQDLGIDRIENGKLQKDKESELSFPHLDPAGVDFPSLQNSLEKQYIEEALQMAGGIETKAAKLLNINHHTFRYRKRKLQIP